MRIRVFSVILLILLMFSGCNADNADFDAPVTFYYIQNEVVFGSESGVIKATTRESAGHTDDYVYLITQYLNGPITYDCISPFPAGTMLEDLSWDQNRVQIVLSPQITTLSGVELTIACACLTRTISGIMGIDTIQIRSSTGLLNGEQVLTFSADNFMYQDNATPSDRLH